MLLLGPMLPGIGIMVPPASGGGGPVVYQGPGDQAPFKMWWGLRAYSTADRGQRLVNVCNIGNVACVDMMSDATTGALVITSPGGTNCATPGNCLVKTFYDRSGQNSCGGAPCDLPAVPANQYSFVTSCIGSLPCVNGLGGSATTAANCALLSQPWSISIVYNTTAAGLIPILRGGSNSGFWVNLSAGTIDLFAGTNTSANASNGAWHAAQGVANGASSSIAVDGTTTSVNPGAASVCGSEQMTFLTDNNGPTTKLAEGGLAAGAWSPAQITALTSNQRTYWGF